MRWRFDGCSFVMALVLFGALVWLATGGARLGWLRSFGGDVLAVAWVYLLLKTVLAARPVVLALAAFAVGCAIEGGQYLATVQHWQIGNHVLRIVLGSTADAWDVLAYACGAALALGGEALGAWLSGKFRAVRRPASGP